MYCYSNQRQNAGSYIECRTRSAGDSIELSIYEDMGSSGSRNFFIDIENTTNKKITLFCRPGGTGTGARMILDGSASVINLVCNEVQFNGARKW